MSDMSGIAQTIGVTFVYTNSWVNEWYLGRNSLHIKRKAVRHLGQLYSRVCGIDSGRKKMRSE